MPKAKTYKWRVGWSPDRRVFHFHAPNGYQCTLSGPKQSVVDMARESLPRWLAVSEKNGDDPPFVAAIRDAIANLPPITETPHAA